MERLRQAIATQGRGIGSDIVKVDGFLNHRIDTGLLFAMGEAFARAFSAGKPDLVLTVEASGIAVAVAAAHALGDVPVVFAKKARAVNQDSQGMLTAPVYSFTHKTQNVIRADRKYLPAGSRVLVIDDFLANGEAARGLLSLVKQAGCTAVGVGAVIEKGFQSGGSALRAEGVKVVSLAIVTGIDQERIVLADD